MNSTLERIRREKLHAQTLIQQLNTLDGKNNLKEHQIEQTMKDHDREMLDNLNRNEQELNELKEKKKAMAERAFNDYLEQKGVYFHKRVMTKSRFEELHPRLMEHDIYSPFHKRRCIPSDQPPVPKKGNLEAALERLATSHLKKKEPRVKDRVPADARDFRRAKNDPTVKFVYHHLDKYKEQENERPKSTTPKKLKPLDETKRFCQPLSPCCRPHFPKPTEQTESPTRSASPLKSKSQNKTANVDIFARSQQMHEEFIYKQQRRQAVLNDEARGMFKPMINSKKLFKHDLHHALNNFDNMFYQLELKRGQDTDNGVANIPVRDDRDLGVKYSFLNKGDF